MMSLATPRVRRLARVPHPVAQHGLGDGPRPRAQARRPSAFTLIELIVVVALMSILLGIVTLAFRSLTDGAVVEQARNTIITYARLARSYAMANEIETMMVVNPYNGHLELWHLNPSAQGGVWDPISSYDPSSQQFGNPRLADGYVFAAIFDSGARLPTSGGVPKVAVHPIDFYDFSNPNQSAAYLRPVFADSEGRNLDNLIWPAFCFDAGGRLVIRTRRIATRVGLQPIANRLPDGRLDISFLRDPNIPPRERFLVRGGANGDTAITSTVGFVISDVSAMADVLPPNPTPKELVDEWLVHTIPGQTGGTDAESFSTTVILNRYSGHELAEAS